MLYTQKAIICWAARAFLSRWMPILNWGYFYIVVITFSTTLQFNSIPCLFFLLHEWNVIFHQEYSHIPKSIDYLHKIKRPGNWQFIFKRCILSLKRHQSIVKRGHASIYLSASINSFLLSNLIFSVLNCLLDYHSENLYKLLLVRFTTSWSPSICLHFYFVFRVN